MSEYRPSDEFAQATQHEIWPVSRTGDLLVVEPQGDLVGFPGHSFRREAERVSALARRPEFNFVLVDLANANYFGSEMIGAIINLARVIAESAGVVADGQDGGDSPPAAPGPPAAVEPPAGGGLVEFIDRPAEPPAGGPKSPDSSGLMAARGIPRPEKGRRGRVLNVCSVSDDMQASFSMMNVDRLWRTYPDREAAEADLATVPVRERIGPLLRPLIALAGAVALGALLWAVTSPGVREALFPPTAQSDLALLRSADLRWRRAENTALSEEARVRDGVRVNEDLEWALRRLKKFEDLPAEHREVVRAALSLRIWMISPSDEAAEEAYKRKAEPLLARGLSGGVAD